LLSVLIREYTQGPLRLRSGQALDSLRHCRASIIARDDSAEKISILISF